MKIIKPFRISPLTRLYRMHGEEHLGVAALMVATLGDDPRLLTDSELWNLAGDELGGYTLDMALPKACPEFLVSGHAYGKYADAPGGGTCEVGIGVAGIEKRLRVSGDRQWDGMRATAPRPFERLALDWAFAYGGAGCEDNPRGRGAERRQGAVRYLPNIEYAHSPMRFPDQRPVPAGFCPIDAAWPQRAGLYGEHDQQWLEEDCPGFPRTLDPRYFNIAPADQQLIALSEFPDGAAYELMHLHPEHALLTGRLPALRARTFVVRTGSETPEEIPMRLTTAWFVPHRERVVMIYHGVTTIRAFDASDVQTLLFGADASAQARPAEWYRQVIEWRTRHEKAALYALRDQDLLPDRYLSPDFPAMSGAVPQDARQRLLRDKLSAFPDAGQIETPRPDQLVEFVERQEAAAEEQRTRLEEMRRDLSSNEAFANAARRGPPASVAIAGDDAAQGAAAPADRSDIRHMQRDADESLRKLYLQSAQHQDAPERLDEAASRPHRERVAAAIAAGLSLEGADLTGVDLAGMDLRGARLSGAMLENADLSGADLSDAALSHAVLARANLRQTGFRNADLTGANLSLANCDQTDFSGANLSDCILERVHLRNCRLNGGIVANTRFSDCRFHAVDFRQATLCNLIFIDQSFEDADFSETTIRKMLLMNCTLANVRFSAASIEGFGIIDARAPGQLRFDRASVIKACFVQQCDIGRADFSSATLKEVNFRETNLRAADFGEARIGSCDFTDACLQGSNFRGAKAEGSYFVRADFAGADLRDTDLIAAYLRGATLDGADLRRANLFRANLSQILADVDTRWEEAYLHKAMRFPRAEARA
ncbi:DUF2169 family type VI secretion system accessory protein [Burkholderia oklahomensis]|uniref:DUF2169 family type VI secretion system accessory protein n=1 Tax=Burkholderia oklahomensis TaxID=342113 RepID=UPI00016A94AD|nr:DUF2169 domain-containing protein [Burkholderia oklahomensis]AOI49241.1 hypothetical protein WI23_25990 [Burkholderia oklahomensis C6786]KUY60712.1 hypothetical protein WI23_13520 [Burkholderia oklahomensis C6786]MBI0362517.1 DUF2169 domain-containing protein [Burkholderia oklahomensis]SUY26627.1 Type III effector pipB2 [Burkholderia oklahomensis]